MSIRFRCKNCNQKYEMDDDCAGDTVECAKCKNPMLVPQQSEIPPSASSTQAAAPVVEVPAVENKQSEVQEVRVPSGISGEIVLRCKVCNQKYRLPKELAGQTAECAKCKNPIIIPGVPEIAPADAASTDNVTFWCKSCGHKVCMPKTLAGQNGECVKCKKIFKVPAESEAKLAGMLSRLRQEVSEKRDAPAKILPKTPSAGNGAPAKSPEPSAGATAPAADDGKAAMTPVKYVLEMPEHNFIFAFFPLMTDWLMQTRLLHRMPRKLVVFLFIFTILLAAALVCCGIMLRGDRTDDVQQVNVMCAACNSCETRPFKDAFVRKCSKCAGRMGFQWKCESCKKIFTSAEAASNDSSVQYGRIDTLKPAVCPFCRSTSVKYNSN